MQDLKGVRSTMERLPKALWLGLGLLLLLAPACVAQSASDQALVDQFFPQRLLDDFAEMYPDDTPDKESAFVAADLNGTGTPEFLVAVYAVDRQQTVAAVRVLHKEGNSAVLVSEPACSLSGRNPDISVIDLDHSGRPQFLVEIAAGRSAVAQMIFKWNGTALEVSGPYATDPDDGTRQPILYNAQFVDLDGDGILEAVNPPDFSSDTEETVKPHTYEVYKLTGGAWVKSDVVYDFFFSFGAAHETEFAAADPASSHFMTIVNGNGRDGGPVTSAEIRLNGALVAGPDQINAQVGRLHIPVTVLGQNTLNVKVTGGPDSELEIAIGPEHAPTISIAPATATLGVSRTQQFTATFTGTNKTAVIWRLNGPGQIDESGLYTAPDTIDTARIVIVTAWRDADTASIATATINLQPSVRVWMEPPNVSLYQSDSQQFIATVYGTANTAVTWSLDPLIGKVSASGLYTAPARVTESRYVSVTATSQADPTKSAYAGVVILPPVPQVSVSPPTVTLYTSQTQQFTATVLNAKNTAVSWSLSPNVGAIDDSGVYTAPAMISGPRTVTVTATCQADRSVKANATITLKPRVSSSITAPPGLTATAVSRSRIELSWSASSAPGGSIAGYNVFRDGTLVASAQTTSYSDLGLVRSATYAYTVTAYDAQGDNSAPSSSASATTLSDPPPPGLVASYNFEEGAGSVLHDSSGHGNNGAITGAEWSDFGHKALNIVSGSSVIVPGSASLDLTSGMTLEAWIDTDSLGGWHPVIVKEQKDGLCYGLFTNNTWPTSRIFIGGEQYVSGSQRLPWGGWTHLASTYDGAALKVYMNGVLAGSKEVTGAVLVSTQALRIGNDSVWDEYFHGSIGDVRIYNRALSQAEIASDMQSVRIAVSPASVTLHFGETQQFTATVANATDPSVSWSISPQVGTISETGLYTAPASVALQQPVTITALSNYDRASTGTATVTLAPQMSGGITTPQGLTAVADSCSSVNLSWTASTKPGGAVAGYYVYRNGLLAGSTAGTSYSDRGLLASTAYTYAVAGYDAQGNISSQSNSAGATTLAGPPAPGLAAWYNFNEGTGSSLLDASGNGNNGVITNPRWRAGKTGSALAFDSSSWVTVPHSGSLDLTTGVTLEAWVNPATLDGTNFAISKDQSYSLLVNWDATNTPYGGKGVVWVDDPGGVVGASGLPLNAWTHIAYTYDGAMERLFVNGVQVDSAPRTDPVATANWPLFIGSYCDNCWYGSFDFMLDEVRIYNRALSLAEIQNDMQLPPVSVAISPATAVLSTSETQQFTANVPVTWSIEPTVGTIDASGLYTAPAMIAMQQTIAVTATSQANSTAKASATITLMPRTSGSLTAPQAVTATSVSPSQIDLSWTAPTGGAAVGYSVFRNGALVGSSATTSFSDLAVACSGSYTYTVSAYDAQGNISALSASASVAMSPGAPTLGLAAYYTFNEGAGATVHDCSGNGNDGVITAPEWSSSGKWGSGLSLHGGMVTVPDSSSLDLTSGTTLEAWVNPRYAEQIVYLIEKPADEWRTSYGIFLFPDNYRDTLSVDYGLSLDTTTASLGDDIPWNAWTHLAFTFDGATLKAYWNGQLHGTRETDGVIRTSPDPLFLGRTLGHAAGVMDEVRIYSLALDQNQIQNDMQNAANVFVSPNRPWLYASQAVQLTAAVTKMSNTGVTWSLSPNIGTLNASGLYTAPATIEAKQYVTVTVTSQADSARTAQAVITLMPPIQVTVSPATVTLYAGGVDWYEAKVINARVDGVTWSISPNIGTIEATSPVYPWGVYYAPYQIDTPQVVTVIATSKADGITVGTAKITLLPPVAVSVSPASSTLYPSQTQRFTATVANASNTNVTWSLDPSLGAVDGSGLYTAPASVNTPQIVVLTATSQANSGATASVTITVTPRLSASITVPQLTAAAVSQSEIDLSWSASTEAGGVIAGYNVLRNGVLIGSTSATSYADLGLVRSTAYSYTVVAYDAQGNISAPSASVGATTFSGAPAPGLTAFYKFNEGTGETLYDFSGSGNNGAVLDATWTTSGKLGGALEFNGTSSWVTVPDSGSLGLTTGMTVEAWVNPRSLADWTAVAVKEQDGDLCYALFASSAGDAPAADVFIGADLPLTGTSRIPLSAWTHLATTYDGTTHRLYVNGILAASRPQMGAMATSSQPLRIGGDNVWGDYFNGMIDEVRIYDRALSQSEIQDDMLGVVAVTVAVAPAGTALYATQTQQFTATVTNAANPAVTWTVSPNVGTISASGLYAAPALIDARQTVTVTAVSVADATKSASATVTLFPVGVAVSPARANVYAGQAQQFTASVMNASNTSVNWSVSPADGGTINSVGVYLPPGTVSTERIVTVTVVSQADPARSATATVRLLPARSSGAAWYNPAWGYRNQIAIDRNQVSGAADLADFPVVIKRTDTHWRSVANGGGVGTADGSDIMFTTADGVTKLSHEMERYSATTGELVAWVRVPVLSVNTDTVLYMYYGNAAAADQQDRTGTWNNSYKAVHHFKETTGPALDSTSSGNNATPQSGVSHTAAGKLGGGYSFDGTANGLATIAVAPSWNGAFSKYTIEAWINLRAPLANQGAVTDGTLVGAKLGIRGGNTVGTWVAGLATTGMSGCEAISSPLDFLQIADGQYHHMVLVVDAVASRCSLYADGQLVGTDESVNGVTAFNAGPLYLGGYANQGSNLVMDEVRLLPGAALSADWVATEYANQSSPEGFYAVNAADTLQAVTIAVAPQTGTLYASQTQQFTATVTNTANPAVAWTITPNVGTISATGLYTAPASITSQQTVTVAATSVADASKTAAATITLKPAITVSVSPTGANLAAGQSQQFTASVTNTSNPVVTWTIAPNVGTITAAGLYTAPAMVSAQQTVTLTATSVADATKSASIPVTLFPVVVGMSPARANVYAGQAQQFTASVVNASNTSVNWSVSPADGGTINSVGVYLPPGTVSTERIVTVTVVSQADPARSATATVKLLPPRSSGAPWYNAAWANRKQIAIDHTRVSGTADLVDFAVLIKRTDAEWRSAANGGGVGKEDGSDIVFTAADGTTKLSHEIEKYAGTTGEVVAWVRVPALSVTTDTVLYLYYGNAAATDQQDRSGTWNSNYKVVQHFKEASGPMLDSTGNGNNATPLSGATFTPAGKMGGGYGFDGTANGLATIANAASWNGAFGKYTVEFWVNVRSAVAYRGVMANGDWVSSRFSIRNGNTAGSWVVSLASSGSWGCDLGSGALSYLQMPDGQFHHLAVVFDSPAGKCYLYTDGNLAATDSYLNGNTSFAANPLYLGGYNASGYTTSTAMDELRLLPGTALSADWVVTEYANQSSPEGFYAVNGQEAASRI